MGRAGASLAQVQRTWDFVNTYRDRAWVSLTLLTHPDLLLRAMRARPLSTNFHLSPDENKFARSVAQRFGIEAHESRAAVFAEYLLRKHHRDVNRAEEELDMWASDGVHGNHTNWELIGLMLADLPDSPPTTVEEMDERINTFMREFEPLLDEKRVQLLSVLRSQLDPSIGFEPAEPEEPRSGDYQLDNNPMRIYFNFLVHPTHLPRRLPRELNLAVIHARAEQIVGARLEDMLLELGIYARSAEQMRERMEDDHFRLRLAKFYHRASYQVWREFETQLRNDLALIEPDAAARERLASQIANQTYFWNGHAVQRIENRMFWMERSLPSPAHNVPLRLRVAGAA